MVSPTHRIVGGTEFVPRLTFLPTGLQRQTTVRVNIEQAEAARAAFLSPSATLASIEAAGSLSAAQILGSRSRGEIIRSRLIQAGTAPGILFTSN